MGFLETGFPIFALILVWNIYLVGFGGIPESNYLDAQDLSVTIQGIDQSIDPATPYIAPTETPEGNIPFLSDAFDGAIKTGSLVSKVALGGAEALNRSGIPQPINMIVSFIFQAFMIGYLSLLFFAFVSAIRGGAGASGA